MGDEGKARAVSQPPSGKPGAAQNASASCGVRLPGEAFVLVVRIFVCAERRQGTVRRGPKAQEETETALPQRVGSGCGLHGTTADYQTLFSWWAVAQSSELGCVARRQTGWAVAQKSKTAGRSTGTGKTAIATRGRRRGLVWRKEKERDNEGG